MLYKFYNNSLRIVSVLQLLHNIPLFDGIFIYNLMQRFPRIRLICGTQIKEDATK